ncbi:MAG: acyl carrier protein [Piptocephalis tieghemiana]|nr:MAG: acyl carrier protein [Piptocephalis tieghemiana]
MYSSLRPAGRPLASLVRKSFTTPQLPSMPFLRAYSAAAGVSKEDIQARILEVVRGFEKTDESKVVPSAHFTKDLGLDSLDTVEVVMCIEDEFSVEIPDAEADQILTVQQAIDYISSRSDAT